MPYIITARARDGSERPVRFERYYRGVRYVAPHKPAPATFARCGHCGRAWDDAKPTALTPAPSGRCPFEHTHTAVAAVRKARRE
jgi:hypothetical protein